MKNIVLTDDQIAFLNSCINSESLFFGQSEIKSIINDSNLNQKLIAYEVYDWINSLYWGESLGVRHALKMLELTNEKTWSDILTDELDHQKRILEWMLDNGFRVTTPNLLIKRGLKYLAAAEASKDFNDDMTKVIEWGQLFLEELGTVMSKWRLQDINNRSLRSIIYKIFKDERKHISTARRILSKSNEILPNRYEMMEKYIGSIFPFQISNSLLDRERAQKIKSISKSLTVRIIEKIKNNEDCIYKPIPIIRRWEKSKNYHCFVCSPTRSEGMQLEPILNEDQTVFDYVVFNKRFEGLNGIIHGGFISMILDEMLCYAPILIFNKMVVTTDLKITFVKPIKTGVKYKVISRIVENKGQFYVAEGKIVDSNDKLHVSAVGTLFNPDENIAKRILPDMFDSPELAEMLFV